MVQGKTIPKTENQYEDGRCTVCGAAAPTEDAPAVSETLPSEMPEDNPVSSEPAGQEISGTKTEPAEVTQPPETSDGTAFKWPVLVPGAMAVMALCAVVVTISRRKK